MCLWRQGLFLSLLTNFRCLLSFWNFPLCSAFHIPGKLACGTLHPLYGKSLFIILELRLWCFGQMLLQLETFHGSNTFHGSPRPFTSAFLCKGIALCIILEFPVLNLPILAIFKEKSHHGSMAHNFFSHLWWNRRNSGLIKPCISGVQQHDSRGLRKASIWVLRCFFLMQNILFCICLGGSLVI